MCRLSRCLLPAIALSFLSWGCEGSKKDEPQAKLKGDTVHSRDDGASGPNIDHRAPEIAGEDMDGKIFKLSDYRGKIVILDFWSTH